MFDQCLQYKEDYEKLLQLKQEFDAVIKNGEADRDFSEAKRTKTELEKAMVYLERDLKFKVWKTIELGTGLKTADDFIRALEEGGYEITDTAKYLMEQSEFNVFPEKTKFELVIISVAELGFSEGATVKEIYKRAKEMGLELCPPETGPQLCLQCKNHLMHKCFSIAMETIKHPNGDSLVFRVKRDGGALGLGAYCGSLGIFWGADCRWVFARRRPGDKSPGPKS